MVGWGLGWLLQCSIPCRYRLEGRDTADATRGEAGNNADNKLDDVIQGRYYELAFPISMHSEASRLLLNLVPIVYVWHPVVKLFPGALPADSTK
jgi:hypothetical protein